jgi:carboxypeptidase family protein
VSLILVILLIQSALAAQSPTPGTAIVEGRVVDAADKPVGGAIVWANLSTLSPRPPAVITGADGRFRLTNIPSVSCQIQVSRTGYLPGGYGKLRPSGPLASLTPTGGQRISDLTIRLWQPAIIGGRVLNDRGQPIVGAAVNALALRLAARPSATGQFSGPSTRTNDRGEYELILPPGQYAVVVPVSHITWPIGVWADRNGFQIIPTRAPTRVQSLISPDGRFQTRIDDGLEPQVSTDGRWSIFVTTFHPNAPTLGGASIIDVAAGGERREVDIHVVQRPRVLVRGRAVGPAGPMAQVVLELQPDPALLPMKLGGARVTTHDDGTFVFMSAPPGEYTLSAWRELRDSDVIMPDREGYWARMPLSVGERDVQDVVVTLQPGVTISGLYESDGALIPARPSFRLEAADGEPDLLRRNGAGVVTTPPQFTITGVRPGRYVLRASLATGWYLKSAMFGGRDVADEPFDVGGADLAGVVVTFTNKASEVRGVVTDLVGATARDATVVGFPVDAGKRIRAGQTQRRIVQTRVAPDGTYLLRGLPAGDYFIAAVSESRMDDWPDPAFLETISKEALRGSIKDGESHTLFLRLSGVRR